MRRGEDNTNFPPRPLPQRDPSSLSPLLPSVAKKSTLISALGLDVGKSALACQGVIAQVCATGLTTIERQSFNSDLAQIQRIVQEPVQILVVGLPYSRMARWASSKTRAEVCSKTR